MPHTPSASEPSKKSTHKAFSEFDDIATEMIIDWAPRNVIADVRPNWNPPGQVRKMNLPFQRSHDTSLIDICEIISLLLSGQHDMNAGLHALLETPSLRSYVDMLPVPLRSDFVRHVCQYLKVHLPDCPFDISATARYIEVMDNACFITRKKIAKGTEIKYLRGKLVSIPPDKEEALGALGLNFSILASDLTGVSNVLGPARLLNHDCESNAR
jgi:histone-lysine N-methyltransferase SUV420H